MPLAKDLLTADFGIFADMLHFQRGFPANADIRIIDWPGQVDRGRYIEQGEIAGPSLDLNIKGLLREVDRTLADHKAVIGAQHHLLNIDAAMICCEVEPGAGHGQGDVTHQQDAERFNNIKANSLNNQGADLAITDNQLSAAFCRRRDLVGGIACTDQIERT